MKLPRLFTTAIRKVASSISAVALAIAVISTAPESSAQTYFNLAANNFIEEFATISSNVTWATPSTGSWAGVAAGGTATIPEPTRITALSTAFQTGFSGGVQRGSTQSPSAANIVFLATGATSNTTSTALDLLLNFTARVAGNLSFNAGSLTNSTGNRTGTLSVYASTDNSTWTSVSGTNLPFVAVNNVSQNATINVALPALLNNQSQVRLRFYYSNGGASSVSNPGGSRPKITLDNVSVTSTPAVVGIPTVNSAATDSVTANSPYSYTITATDSPTTFSASPLPAGLSISGAVISGTPTTPGVYTITLSAENGSGIGQATLSLTVGIDPLAPVVTVGQTVQTILGELMTPYQITLSSNSASSYTSSALPAGLSLDGSTGIISGTPSARGTFSVTVNATNTAGTGTATISIVVGSSPVVTSESSASGYINSAFTYTISVSEQTTYPTTAVNWPNVLPDGLSTTTAKVLSGTPTTAGTYTLPVDVVNDIGTTSIVVTLKFIDQSTQNSISKNVVINEYANSTPDRVELLAIGTGVPGSTTDMRGMILKDFSNNVANDNGGKSIFASSDFWSAVPAGTLLVLSGGTTQTEDLDASDFVLRVNLGNTAYFTSFGSFDIATTEMVMIKAAGYGTLGVAGGIHALASAVDSNGAPGTAGAQYTAFLGSKLIARGQSGADTGVFAVNGNATLADFTGTDATASVALASFTFGAANNSTNGTYITSLRTAPVSSNANLSALSLSGVTLSPLFASGTISYTVTVANSVTSLTVTPTVEQGNATVTVNGTAVTSGAASGSISLSVGSNVLTTVVTAQDGVTTKSYTVTVTRSLSALESWRSSTFSGTAAAGSTATTGLGANAADFDGDGVINLLEYATGTDATAANASPVTVSQVGNFLTLSYPVIEDSSLTYTVQGTNDLTTTFTAGAGATTGTTVKTYTDTVDLSAAGARRFLRLQVTSTVTP